MSATDASSMDKTRLGAILDDMYRLEVLSGLLEECDALIGQTRRRGAETPLRGPDLLQEVLKLQQDKWIRPEQIAPLPARLGISELPQEISFLREFKELARIIPLKAYADPEQRPRFVDAVQLALDDAIDREEEEDDAW
jgi:type III secretion protein W